MNASSRTVSRRTSVGTRSGARAGQRGMFLIEALVSVLLFAIGILGMVGMSALATASQSDAQYRTLAAGLANKMAQEAWLRVARSEVGSAEMRATALRNSLATFQHQPTGQDCNFSGAAATEATTATSSWHLPGATASMQQVLVDTDPATGFNRMTITVCWAAPANPVKRQHVLVTYVN
ncbi:MAG: type IV pilus modification protein PilV [Comamonadaceae bacterium]|nr:MAG: type IV pilus modification protein PilV [Comamonadaceae bacterium]